MPKPKVKMYSTTWCGFCAAARNFFETHKIPYEDVDIEKNPKEAQEMMEKSGQMGVPVININGKIIIGFDQPAIKKALKIK